MFGPEPAIRFTAISDTPIMAVSPSGTGAVDMRVTTPGGISPISPADLFTYSGILAFPTVILPVTGVIALLGTVLIIWRTREM